MTNVNLRKVLEDHGVNVIHIHADVCVVDVQELDTKTGELYWVQDRIPATIEGVRAFLGY